MIKMNERDCYYCIKRGTMHCPNSSECYATQDKPSFRTKELALKEIEQLREQLKELKHIMYVIRDDNGLKHLWCKDMILDWLGSDK